MRAYIFPAHLAVRRNRKKNIDDAVSKRPAIYGVGRGQPRSKWRMSGNSVFATRVAMNNV
jgi:hypothetical protein